MWMQLLFVALAAFFVWLVYRSVKNNPQAFSRASFAKSFMTMGLLALVLIGFVTLLVFMLR